MRGLRESRRRVLAGLALTGVGALTPRLALAQVCARSCETEEGPFYPRAAIPVRSDLTGPGAPQGQMLIVVGDVRDADCAPAREGWVTSWQADANGSYDHPAAQNEAPLDPNFHYFGKQAVNAAGAYRLATILPAPYTFRGLRRAPHIHFVFERAGRRLVTELYFDRPEDVQRRSADRIWVTRDPRTRQSMIVNLRADAGGAASQTILWCRYDVTIPA